MLNNIEIIKDFFNWKSIDKFKNPFTLTIIQLYDFVKINNKKTTNIFEKSYISKKEFYHIDNKLPKLYRKQDLSLYNGNINYKIPKKTIEHVSNSFYKSNNNHRSNIFNFFVIFLYLLLIYYLYCFLFSI